MAPIGCAVGVIAFRPLEPRVDGARGKKGEGRSGGAAECALP